MVSEFEHRRNTRRRAAVVDREFEERDYQNRRMAKLERAVKAALAMRAAMEDVGSPVSNLLVSRGIVAEFDAVIKELSDGNPRQG